MNALVRRVAVAAGIAALMLSLAGCGGGNMEDLRSWVAQVKARHGSKIPPVPKPTPYQAYTYDASGLRSPFIPAATPGSGVRPNLNRKKQYLEQFPLDSLKFVGEIDFGGEMYALIQDPEGMVHRVTTGNYLGQNNGRVVAIGSETIRLDEIVPNGKGGWQRRPASLSLAQKSGG